MAVSILHRGTGDGLAIVGAMLLVWWLYAIANGTDCYATFQYYVWQAEQGDALGVAANILGKIVLVGLTWAFFQHMLSGLRHFVMDMGAGYELKANRSWSIVIMCLSVLLTVVLWAWIFVGRAL